MSEGIRRRAVVRGQVQGVFFRDTCRRLAQQSGVAGSVSNEPDGTVLAVFEGDADAVRQMLDWCRTGPPSAHVDGVDVTDEQPTGESGFSVR